MQALERPKNSQYSSLNLHSSVLGVMFYSDRFLHPSQKEVDLWTKDFSALFNPMFRSDKQTTVVLLNAIGYVFISMATAEYPGKDEFLVCASG